MVSTKDWFEVGCPLDTCWLVHGRAGGSDGLPTEGGMPDQARGVERQSAGSSRDGYLRSAYAQKGGLPIAKTLRLRVHRRTADETVCLQPGTLRCVRCSGVRLGSRLTQPRHRPSCGRGSYPIIPSFAPIDPSTLTGVRTPEATHFGRSFYPLLHCVERSHPQRGARCI